MGRPLSLRIGGSRAALGSRPPGGLAGEPGARIAVGVGVVVSAFRFTPFFLARGWAGGAAETARSGGPAECKDLRRGEEMTDGWGMFRTVVGISGGGVYK